MRQALDRFYRWCQRLLVPELRPSQYAFAEILNETLARRTSWLDLGCGRRLLPEWMPDTIEKELRGRVARRVGTDLDLASLRDHAALSARVQASADALPFSPRSFDIVSANMVMEHIEQPGRVLAEIGRVLRPGGVFVFHTPNRRYWAIRIARVVPQRAKALLVRLLEGRAEEDVFPTRYRFNDAGEIARLAADAGFHVERLDAVSSSPVTAMLGPLVLVELCWIRWLRRPGQASSRSNFIGVLRAGADR